MKKVQLGFSLVEVLLSVSVFSLIVMALTGGLIYGQQSTAMSGMRARAAMLADEGMEAARNIRDENYSHLSNGTYGLAITSNQWAFSGFQDATDIFTRSITITDAGTNRKQITSTVTWQQNPQRNGTIAVVSYLTNWKASSGVPPGTCTAYCQSLPVGYNTGICRQNAQQCIKNGETAEPGGNQYCPGTPPIDTCCCAP